MKTNRSRTTKLLGLSAILSTLAFTQHARSSVIVSFEQVGSDVKMSWSGTLDFAPFSVGASINDRRDTFTNTSYNYSIGANPYYVAATGTYNTTDLGYSATSATVSLPGMVGAWGFYQGNLYWSGEMITGGTASAPTQITYDPSKQFSVIPNKMLAALNAAAFDNTVAWREDHTMTPSFTPRAPCRFPSRRRPCCWGSAE